MLQYDQNIAQARTQVSQIKVQLSGLGLAARDADAGLRATKAQLEQKRLSDLSSQVVTLVAPKNGVVTNILARHGDAVAANQALALIVPSEGKEGQLVHLWVPSKAVGFVREGTAVRIMYDAFPYQTFGTGKGRVAEISRAPLSPRDLPQPIETKEQMYRITVKLERNSLTAYGREWPILPGMRLSADLVLDKKSLMAWLFDPILAARQRAA